MAARNMTKMPLQKKCFGALVGVAQAVVLVNRAFFLLQKRGRFD